MWLTDFPEHDPDSKHPDPTARQILCEERAKRQLARLKATLEKLTVPQPRALIGTIADSLIGSTFRRTPFKPSRSDSNGSVASGVSNLADARRRRRR